MNTLDSFNFAPGAPFPPPHPSPRPGERRSGGSAKFKQGGMWRGGKAGSFSANKSCDELASGPGVLTIYSLQDGEACTNAAIANYFS